MGLFHRFLKQVVNLSCSGCGGADEYVGLYAPLNLEIRFSRGGNLIKCHGSFIFKCWRKVKLHIWTRFLKHSNFLKKLEVDQNFRANFGGVETIIKNAGNLFTSPQIFDWRLIHRCLWKT